MTAYDAFVHATGSPNWDQTQGLAIFDGGYFATWSKTIPDVWELHHVDSPDAIISSVVAPTTYNERTGHDNNGHNYFIYNIGQTSTYYIARVNLVGTTISFTTLNTFTTTQGNGFFAGGMWVDPTNSVIHVKSYHGGSSGDDRYRQKLVGFSTSTGAVVYEYWTYLTHGGTTDARLNIVGATAPNRFVAYCNTHGFMELIDTDTLTALDGISVYQWSQFTQGYMSYGSVFDNHKIILTADAGLATNIRVSASAYDVSGDYFSQLWGPNIWETDWNQPDYWDDGIPVSFSWKGSNKIFIMPGYQNYSGSGWELDGWCGPTQPITPYIIDATTGEVSAGEPTRHFGDGISFWSVGTYMAGRCGDNYMFCANQINANGPQVTYRLADRAAPLSPLYYRNVSTDNDTLSWTSAEQQLTTNWTRGTIIKNASVHENRIAIGLGQPFASTIDQSRVYWLDPFTGASEASEPETNASIMADGFQEALAVAGPLVTADHHWVMDISSGDWPPEMTWGYGGFTLWGFCAGALPPLRLGGRNDGEGITERHGRINTVRQEWSSDRGNRLQYGQKGTYQ